MVKLPYSSVVANARLSNWLLGVGLSLSQVTATLAPDQTNTQLIVNSRKVKHQPRSLVFSREIVFPSHNIST
jgi:hypothetical protein